eukprot:TRINITY_DN834_c0_g1_i1.p1 TRINITY_DN834_c0_g1~~TRINITY_DN834_c0_g1_i1.p1  ORF type:complete len:904 (-),score=332.36 TRINITY_DN834_c0_g1_i1:166-2877(-)
MNYQGNKKYKFLRITLAAPKLVPPCRSICESGFEIPGYGYRSYLTFESNILFALRFMIDTNMVGANWLEFPPGSYKIINENNKSNCQIEVAIHYSSIISYLPDSNWSDIAPIRLLSFDIECAGRKGLFPELEHYPVIQIANLVTLQGQKKHFIRNVFTLKSCAIIVGAEVKCFNNEREMLKAWRDFVIEVDPDLITGYNISNFDLWYLLSRAKQLKIDEFDLLGRIVYEKSRIKDGVFSSKAYGTRETKTISLTGRVQFDVLQLIQREYKLRSYSLNSVSAHFLGEQKEDVHYSIISDLFNGSAEDRRRLAVYCLKDALLPLRLLDKLMFVINYIEMARVTGVPFGYLLARGQQVKVISKLYRQANKEDLLIPVYPIQDTEEKYEGATVIEPKKGFYDIPIPTLDFTSLYPSIMMAYNLCYSTLLKKNEADSNLTENDYIQTPSGDRFVKANIRKGVLPRILEDLLAARKKAKDDLKNESDPFKCAVLDGRQLALKISANSVYGFTGATVGKLPCIEISASVTSYGREMIETTKKIVESHYTIENGYKNNAIVIYGDTDSVMVNFGVNDVTESMKLGLEAARLITPNFPRPINLDFEKVYFPYLLINKKRYAGLLWTNPSKHDKMDAKGIETVRRDNCPLVKDVINSCLHKILIERDTQGAINYTKGVISDLLQNKIDLSQLVITKALSKRDYTVKQAHVELAERMRQRDAGSAPALGDRVPYVIIQATKGARNYERSEDPLWVLENNIPLDANYYLEQQLANPLLRIFEPIMENPKTLLYGEHTRTITRAVPTSLAGNIIQFTQKKSTCIGCRIILSSNDDGLLCEFCKPRAAQIYREKQVYSANLEYQFSSVWTQCQICQGSLHQNVLCTSRDCPIFYQRKKIQKDLKDAQVALEKLDLSW